LFNILNKSNFIEKHLSLTKMILLLKLKSVSEFFSTAVSVSFIQVSKSMQQNISFRKSARYILKELFSLHTFRHFYKWFRNSIEVSYLIE